MRPPPAISYPPTTTTTSYTSHTMSCSQTPTNSHITPSQYNSLLSRLNVEIQRRSEVEADLVSAHEQIAYLQAQLSTTSTPHPHTMQHQHTQQSFRTTLPSTLTQQPNTQVDPPHCPTRPKPDQTHQPPCHNNKTGHDKEILSHCSDISASKSGPRPDPTPTPHLKSVHRKSSINLAAINGVTKKSKSKKERAQKVKIPGQSRYWTPEEHKLFLEALNKFGHKNLRDISVFVGTRNMTQVRTHSQKYFMRLMREAKRQNPVAKPPAACSEDAVSVPDATHSNLIVPAPVAPAPTEQHPDIPAALPKEDAGDKYSVPNTCGMTLLCLVGQDTLPV